jgi:hypothetical protein
MRQNWAFEEICPAPSEKGEHGAAEPKPEPRIDKNPKSEIRNKSKVREFLNGGKKPAQTKS